MEDYGFMFAVLAAIAAVLLGQCARESFRLNMLQAASDATRFAIIMCRLRDRNPSFEGLGEEFFRELPYIQDFGPERLCWPSILWYEFLAELEIGRAFVEAGWVDIEEVENEFSRQTAAGDRI